jgi:hypothetical protein
LKRRKKVRKQYFSESSRNKIAVFVQNKGEKKRKNKNFSTSPTAYKILMSAN